VDPKPVDPNAPVDLTTKDPNAPVDLTTNTATNPTANPPTANPPPANPNPPIANPPPTNPQVAPQPEQGSDELPKLTDPQTTAPDAETLARKQAEEAAKAEAAKVEAERKRNAARVSTGSSRPSSRRDNDDDEPRSAKPSADMGFLRVSAYPSGWVSVDGGPKKAAPLSGLQLPAGKHKIRIFTDYESKNRTVTIVAGKVKVIKVDWDEDAIEED
jgi:hypothetical protein